VVDALRRRRSGRGHGGGGGGDGILVTGGFTQTVRFGATQLTAQGTYPDIFVLRLKAP